VEGIFPCGGEFRTLTRTAALQGGGVTHVPPEPALVPGHVTEALYTINEQLNVSQLQGENDKLNSVIGAAAYALWRFNWIHPFAGGNGRTARSIAHLVLCIDYGGMIPGRPSFPTVIARKRKEYESALRSADAGSGGSTELNDMRSLVMDAMIEQLENAIQLGESRRARVLSERQFHDRRSKKKAARAARRKSRR
jgi:Fic family protein